MSDRNQGHSHQAIGRVESIRSLRDKENAITLAKASANTENNTHHIQRDSKPKLFAPEKRSQTDRTILRSKSSNGLKVQNNNSNNNLFHGQNKLQSLNLGQAKTQPSLGHAFTSELLNNANKARKVLKKPISIFNSTVEKNTQNRSITFHDSVTLQRSQSQLNDLTKKENHYLDFPLHNENTEKSLSRSTSAFSSTLGSNLQDNIIPRSKLFNRRAKSQLSLSANNDLADFFKKSKEEDQKQLGLSFGSLQNSSTIDNTGRIEEVTFADDTDDITSMKKLSTERDSPVYQRTHKVSLHNLLSSSTESEDVTDTTFDYKDKESIKVGVNELENLIMTSTGPLLGNKQHGKKDDLEDIEVEFVSTNKNGRYDESLPDVVLDGLHQPMSEDLLSNLWGKPTEKAKEAAEKFKDPLDLKLNIKEDSSKLEMLEIPEIAGNDALLSGNLDLDLELAFSDDDEEEEDSKENSGEDGHTKSTKSNSLASIMQFYEKKISESNTT